MSDPLPTDAAPDAHAGAEREAKIEQLLLSGLDHYFDGHYDQAINVWTRALFLDRGHARARAYIERARGALAERQRESEELLQRGLDAFDRGATGDARRLIEAAITRGAPRDEALPVLDRIQRLDTPAVSRAEAAIHTPVAVAPPARRVRGAAYWEWLLGGGLLALVVAAAMAGLLPVQVTWGWPPPVQAAWPATAASTETAIPLPRTGARALTRAQLLVHAGRLHDALVSLDHITITDDEKPEADRLRAEIQRQLIAVSRSVTESGAARLSSESHP
ncbi:MAG: hypothetical protein AB7N65_13265 [Vicinamibacterales bacterium]